MLGLLGTPWFYVNLTYHRDGVDQRWLEKLNADSKTMTIHMAVFHVKIILGPAESNSANKFTLMVNIPKKLASWKKNMTWGRWNEVFGFVLRLS